MRCKLKRGLKGQANLGGSSDMVQWKFLKFEVAKDVISCSLGAKQGKIKLVYDHKIWKQVKRWLHLLNTIFFMRPLSLLVLIYCYMSANVNDIRFYSQWSSAVLLRTLWLISVDIPAVIIIPHAWNCKDIFRELYRLYGSVKFSGPPFWALSYDWSCDACVTCVPWGQRLTE